MVVLKMILPKVVLKNDIVNGGSKMVVLTTILSKVVLKK